MSFFKKAFKAIGKVGKGLVKGVGKVAKKALPVAAGFIPGGGAVTTALKGFLGNTASNILGGAAKGLGGVVTDKLFGTSKKANQQLEQDRQWSLDQAERLLTLGNEQDMANQQAMYDYRIDRGLSEGMTPYEMHMGPAGGGGGGTSASGQTLGNAASSAGNMKAQMQFQASENERNRQTQLQQTQMQTDAQVKDRKSVV